MKDKLFSELEAACVELFQAHHLNYRYLTKYGPNMFEDDSTLLAIFDGVEKRKDGRVFILQTLIYFEIKDEPVFYRWCARLKKVLDDYDTRFKITTEQKVKSEESVQRFRSEERERHQSVEKIRVVHRNQHQVKK